jgi:hypothetical protein
VAVLVTQDVEVTETLQVLDHTVVVVEHTVVTVTLVEQEVWEEMDQVVL